MGVASRTPGEEPLELRFGLPGWPQTLLGIQAAQDGWSVTLAGGIVPEMCIQSCEQFTTLRTRLLPGGPSSVV